MAMIHKTTLARRLGMSPQRLRLLDLPRVKAGTCYQYSDEGVTESIPNFHFGPGEPAPGIGDDWMRAAAVAKIVGRHKETVLRWVRQNEIPHYRFGPHSVRFRRAEVDAWLKGETTSE